MKTTRASLLCLFLSVLFSIACYAQPEGVRFAKKSEWITPITFDAQSKPETGQSSSSYYLLLDEQENTITQEDFYHYAYTILTSEGIQEMSDLSFNFDPSYQKLVLHEIHVIRGNTVIDQLSKNIQVVQREQSMDRFLYDGSRTVIVNLKDVRVGDIVEYSFTRKGYNPVHAGHIARTHYFDYYQTIDKYYKKLIFRASKKVNVKTYGITTVAPVIKEVNNETHYEWSQSKTKTIQTDSGTPAWHDAYSGVMLSDFRSWQEVGAWAQTLFTVSDEEKKQLKNEVAGNFPAGADEKYILNVIRFVQDEVRYLGFESGINSHKPYPPKQVYEQRFGDCKDKSLLLTTLLQVRGIEAYPMLVNTSLKHALDERLPAGNIFDHCVVRIIFNGMKINIDPTMSSQGGSLETIFFPDYGRGLVVDNDIEGIEKLPEPQSPTTTEIQNFDLTTVGGEATLTIRTSYSGYDADNQRSQFASTPLENIRKNYTNYYANLYPDITSVEDPTFTDDRAGNVFNVEEKYKIPTFWKPLEGQEGKIFCTLQPQSIATYFDVPKNIQQRTSPYYLSYPLEFYHTTHINLPQEWPVEPVDRIIENELYQYEYAVGIADKEITRMVHYKTKSDHIPAERISTFVKDHTRMYDDLVYQLYYDNKIAASKNSWPGIVFSVVLFIGGAYLMFVLYRRYDPAPFRDMPLGTPIGGWLVLFAIGVVLTPIRVLYDLFATPDLLNGNGWMVSVATERYPLFSYLVVAHAYNILKVLLSVLLAVLFFQRRSSFPMLMTIQIVTSLIMVVADEFIGEAISVDGTTANYKSIAQVLFYAIIWIPYLHMSQRVKETFVIRTNGSDDNSSQSEYDAEAGPEPELSASNPAL